MRHSCLSLMFEFHGYRGLSPSRRLPRTRTTVSQYIVGGPIQRGNTSLACRSNEEDVLKVAFPLNGLDGIDPPLFKNRRTN